MTVYSDWLLNPLARRCVLVELNVSISGVETTLYLSNNIYVDSVAERSYQCIIDGAIETTEELSLDSTAGTLSYGGVSIDNSNGVRDAWLTSAYVWRSRVVTVLFGDNSWARADFTTIFNGIINDLQPNGETGLILTLADKMQRLNTALSEQLLGGLTVNANDLVPIAFGNVCNALPLLTDKAMHEYQVHNAPINDFFEVRDNGVPLTGTSLPTFYTATGKFNLAVSPAGQITCSFQGDKQSAYTDTIAGTIYAIVTRYGKDSQRFTSADVDLTNFSDFDTAHPDHIGFYANSRENTLNVVQQLASSIGAQCFMSRPGKLKLYQISITPAGTSMPIKSSDFIEGSFKIINRLAVQSSVRLNYAKNWTVQEGLQTGIPADHVNFFANEWLKVTATDTAAANLNKQDSLPPGRDTLLITTAQATAEAARELALYTSLRGVYRFESSHAGLLALNLGDPVTITSSRFGLSAGKTGTVVRLQTDWAECATTIDVFGFVEPPIVPTYTITPPLSTITEGGAAVTFAVITTYIGDGTVLYWTTSGDVIAADFTDGLLTGNFAITAGAGAITRAAANDGTDESAEIFYIQVRTVSTAGTVEAVSGGVTIAANGTSYAVTPAASSYNEGTTAVFNIATTGVTNGTFLYWTVAGTGITTADFTGGSLSGSVTITSNAGVINLGIANDATTEGAESFILSLRTTSISGTVVATASSVTINDTSKVLKKGIFAYGSNNSGVLVSISNLVSNTGVIGTDVTGVGTARQFLSACNYGGDKGIFAYGLTTVSVSISNLVSNTGVIGTDVAGVGTARYSLGACNYGGDKGIFAYGKTTVSVSISNLVSNTGVIGTDVTGVGTARLYLSACNYGGDKGIFAYGYTTLALSISNLVSNTGVIGTDVAGVGTARYTLGACSYFGGDKGIFAYGKTLTDVLSISNLVSNTGVIGTDVAGVGTARLWLSACNYGGDKGIFAYGSNNSSVLVSISNLVSNTGVIGTDVAGVGKARLGLGACSYFG